VAPEIDSAVLVGFPAAERYLGLDGHPSEIYVRTVNNPWVGGLVAALLTGALAGLLPAIGAARLSPTQALLTV